MSVRFLIGDARSRLKELPDESVHCVVTSPPYFGLRDYGTAQWDGGDPACDHLAPLGGGFGASGLANYDNGLTAETIEAQIRDRRKQFRSVCGKCGARRIDSQIGLEATPAAYVAELVAVFREVKRVLRSDGVCWLNLADSFGKDKQLLGIPWKVAFALQDDGWVLRQDVVWSKANPMPESVTDRCTKSHEYVFLLTKSATYAYDAQAIAEKGTKPAGANATFGNKNVEARRAVLTGNMAPGIDYFATGTRNKRSVWTIATAPFPGSHFAVFPPELPELCIRAGTSERGCCPHCGKGWARVVETVRIPHTNTPGKGGRQTVPGQETSASPCFRTGLVPHTTTLGWQPSCSCPPHEPVPATCLDPFGGAGTTGLVADRLGRNAILIELNPAYATMARTRLEADAGMFACLEAAE